MPVPDFHGLSGRHIFLTGGTGAVGRTFLDYLDQCISAGDAFHVTVLTRDAAGFAARHPMQAARPWLTLVDGDLGALPALPVGITDVVHAAADTHVGQGRVAWIDQIVGGTRALLEASRAAGANRFLFVSSGAVYGPQPPSVPRLREDYIGAPDTLLPGSTYGQAKRMAEQLCTVFHAEYGLSTVIARLFAFGSVHIPRDGRYALGNFIRDALSDDDAPIRVAGDGTAVRSYLNGHDMAHALITALYMGVPGQAYNVGSQVPVTIAELAMRVRDRLSPGRDVKILGTAGDGQRSIYVPDVTGIAALGAASQTDLNAVIDDAAGRLSARA